MLTDNIIEQSGVILRNLNNTSMVKDTWVQCTTGAYGIYGVPYLESLKVNHYYYQRFTYKFTTTNQSPTWATFYIQGGMVGGAGISNPVAGTEYTASVVQQTVAINRPTSSYTINTGTIYNGPSNSISGATGYVKNILIYDVTELYTYLLGTGTVSSTATLKTWCDNNLEWTSKSSFYDITSLLPTLPSNKITMKRGEVVANEFIETDGMEFYSINATVRNNTYFDTGSGVSIYNNKGNGTVTHTRIDADSSSPFFSKHKKILKIITNGEASPGAGGFICSHQAAANKVVIETIVAKIPTGYTLNAAYNSQGTGATVTYLTNRAGNNDWKEYKILYRCGSSGSFSNGGHVYLTGSNVQSVTWYLAYVNSCDITGHENLMYYNVLPSTNYIKNSCVYSNEFNTSQLFVNRNFLIHPTLTNLTYDTTDYAGNSDFSLVQAVGAGACQLNVAYPIVPGQRYKVSYWVKCKKDMTYFLTAIVYFTSSGTAIYHSTHVYLSGTYTQLTQDLNTNATEVYVKSVANWRAYSYSKLGFRSGAYKSYNDIGTSNGYNGSTGIVNSVDTTNKKIILNTAYTGSKINSGTYIVESYDGGTYPYPVGKESLPTDNTWKYVEGYFGVANDISDGRASWSGVPADAVSMQLCLNIYTNNGTVPIKYSDIKVEAVNGGDCNRNFNLIQIPGGLI